jgi:hypothetical protein
MPQLVGLNGKNQLLYYLDILKMEDVVGFISEPDKDFFYSPDF